MICWSIWWIGTWFISAGEHRGERLLDMDAHTALWTREFNRSGWWYETESPMWLSLFFLARLLQQTTSQQKPPQSFSSQFFFFSMTLSLAEIKMLNHQALLASGNLVYKNLLEQLDNLRYTALRFLFSGKLITWQYIIKCSPWIQPCWKYYGNSLWTWWYHWHLGQDSTY